MLGDCQLMVWGLVAILEEIFCFFRSHALCEKEALSRYCDLVAMLMVKVLSST